MCLTIPTQPNFLFCHAARASDRLFPLASQVTRAVCCLGAL
ncbi:hypothetical protein [Funiculus sociatus]